MKAIIIQDTDARALLEQLKLENFRMPELVRDLEPGQSNYRQISHDIHARYHYIVCRWLQEQGANVVR